MRAWSLTLLLVALLLPAAASASPPVRLPPVSGDSLLDEPRVLPADLGSGRQLVLVSLQREHADALNAWAEAATPLLPVWEVVVVGEVGGFVRAMVRGGLKMQRGDARRARTLLVEGDRGAIVGAFGGEPEELLVLLVDSQGAVLWSARGGPGVEELEALRGLVGGGS